MREPSLLPSEWQVVRAQDTAEPSPGSTVIGPFGSNLVARDYRPSGVPVVFVRDVSEDGLHWHSDVFVDHSKALSLAAHGVRAGDLVATKMGLPPCVAAEYPSSMPPGIVTADIIRLRPEIRTTDVGWLVRSINGDYVRSQVRAITGGVTRPKVTLRDFRELRLLRPPAPEQRRIAALLDTIDAAIRKTQEIIAKLRQVKHGLLHDLLTCGIDDNGEPRDFEHHPEQFKDSPLGTIPRQWDARLLGDLIGRIEAGKSPSCPDRPAEGDEWGVLKVSAVRPAGLQARENKVIVSQAHVQPAFEIHDGDLLITRANTPELVGLTCLVERPPPRLLLSDKTLRLVVDEEQADTRFLFYVSQMPYVRAQVETHATGSSGSMKNIGQGAIRGLLLKVPPRLEQAAIADRLTTLDRRQAEEHRHATKLRQLRTGLTDDLLTGRVRVTTLLENAAQ
jgi:type I restriction enzyme S subunit